MKRAPGSLGIAKAAAFLVSDEAQAITGINLPVDAGWLIAGSWHTYGGMRPPLALLEPKLRVSWPRRRDRLPAHLRRHEASLSTA